MTTDTRFQIALDVERGDAAKDARRFACSVSSDAPIARRTWDGEWTEILSHARGAVDLSRAPLPLIEGHDRSRTNIGIVENLRVDGGKLRGELVLGASQRARELAEDIGAGIVRSLSVGAEILEQKRDEKAKRITITRWKPVECSIVATPADVSVGIGRSLTVDENENTPPNGGGEGTAAATERAEIVRAERDRVAYIHRMAAKHPGVIGAELARRLVDSGKSKEACAHLLLDRLADYSESIRTEQHIRIEGPGVTPGDDLGGDFQRATVDALLLRSGIRIEKPHAAAGDVSASVYDIARTCLSRAGKSAGFSESRGQKLIERAMTTSDFPQILSSALHASVRKGYEDEPASHRAWVRVAPVQDFRDQERPILGSAPELKQVLEGGEYTSGALDEDSTKYRVAKFGRVISLTWEVLVNDRLAAFLRVQPALGQAARRLEADKVYALFAENAGAGPTMQDTKALFHADHGNLAAAGALDAALLGKGRELLRKMRAVGGGYLALAPRYFIVPVEREQTAEVLLANATRAMTTAKAEPEWIASLQLVVEPRLAANAAYLAADSGQIDHIELGLLEENMGGPTFETREMFERDEVQWKIRHVLGAKALDWRGLVKMPIA